MEVRLESAPGVRIPGPQAPPEKGLDLLQPGRILSALVTATGADGLARLRLGAMDLVAESQVPLQVGERLQLEVITGGQPPLLQIRNPQGPRTLVAATLRRILPRMAPLPQALTDIQGLEAQLRPAPAGVHQALAQVMARLPRPERAMDPEGLRHILEESGIWNEARMVHGQEAGPTDLKQALAQAATRVRAQLPPRGETAHPEDTGDTGAAAKASPMPHGPGSNAGPSPGRAPAPPPSGQGAQAPGSGGHPIPSPSRPIGATPSIPRPDGDQDESSPIPGRAAVPPDKDPASSQVRPQAQPLGRLTQPLRDPALPRGRGPQAPIPAGTKVDADRPLSALRESAQAPRHQEEGTATQGDTTASLRLLRNIEAPLEAALARIRYHQLGSLPGNDPNHQVWQFELPLATREGFEGLRLRIEEQGREHPDPENRRWSLTLEFDFTGLGYIKAQVGLQGEQVSGTFWSERPGTLALIQGELERLRAGLEAKGLAVERLGAHPGAGPDPQGASHPQGPLLSERA